MAKLNKNTERDQWGSKFGFIMAAAGSAVGLGNLWKFPYMAGNNGGGAFVFVYLVILVLIGFTLMLAELALGRYTQLSSVAAYKKINKKYSWIGGIGVLSCFFILSFYGVVGGWVLNYIVKSLAGAFALGDINSLTNLFNNVISHPMESLIYHGLFIIITGIIVIGGISGGIEKYSKILMPGLFIMMTVIMIRSVTLEGASEGIKFFLTPDFSKININVILAALGQVFFSLSLGMGSMITYGSYLSKRENIPESALIIPLLDTAIAILGGLAILPAVFALGLDPAEGPGLIFITLPAVFSTMPFGSLFSFLFFTLIFFAAITSSIALLEVNVAYLVDGFKWNRKISTLIMSSLVFGLGFVASLGFGPWSHISILGDRNIFDSLDFTATSILLPLGGLLMCLFISNVWGLDNAVREITNRGQIKFRLAPFWKFSIKVLAPIAIIIIFLQSSGLLKVIKDLINLII